MKHINIEQICSITTYKKLKDNKIIWLEHRKKTFFRKERKEGFYYDNWYYNGYKFLTEEEIINDSELYIENHEVYYKPFLKIKMSNNEEVRINFKTSEDLDNFINDIGKKIPLLK